MAKLQAMGQGHLRTLAPDESRNFTAKFFRQAMHLSYNPASAGSAGRSYQVNMKPVPGNQDL